MADIILAVLGFLCLILGIVGSIVPALPGPPLSYIGMLLIHFTDFVQFTPLELTIWALAIIIVFVLDFIIPSIGTKKFGGSNYGVWGCNIGIIVGLFGGPLGIILFPFIGAVIGEFIKNNDFKKSVKAGFGAFLGFLTGTLIKVVIGIVLLIYCIYSFF